MWTIYIIFLLGRANKFTDAKYTSFISDVFNLLFLIRTDCLENFVLIFLLYFILCSRSLNVSSRHSFKFQKVQKNLQLSNGKCTIEYKNHEYTLTRRSFSHHLSIFDRIFILNVFFVVLIFLQSCENLSRWMPSSVIQRQISPSGILSLYTCTMKQITLYLTFYNYTYHWNFIPREELKIQRFVPSENDS